MLKEFSFNTFEIDFEKLLIDEKVDFLVRIYELEPKYHIIPVLACIKSSNNILKKQALKNFDIIMQKIRTLLKNPSDKKTYAIGRKNALSVCARIYAKMNSDLALSNLSILFNALLELKNYGSYFALKVIYKEVMTFLHIEKSIGTISDESRLALIDQYLQSSPEIKNKFGFIFKDIIKSVTQRKAVIEFYASLFDRQRDLDLFLYNINPELRDPNKLIINEIESHVPEIRIIGLKALAMIADKIPLKILTKSLNNEKKQSVRSVVFSIIEHSTRNTYTLLSDILLKFINGRNKKDAYEAFKALSTIGNKPIHTLLGNLLERHPSLIKVITSEISNFTPIAFPIINDIAMNKEKYMSLNLDVSLSGIFGIIKKRPERVLSIFQQQEKKSSTPLQKDISLFVKKTARLLELEKADINSEFNLIIEWVKKKKNKKFTWFKKFFLNSDERKINEFLKKKNPLPFNFESALIKDVNLSSQTFPFQALFVNESIITNTYLTMSKFTNAFFKASIFYNVDMQQAEFESVDFDHAVFINVNARQAKFINCNFQNVSIYNCDFSHAHMKDASFLYSKLSRVSFYKTDLSFSTFAFAKISAISFLDTNINQADFTGVQSKFCRLPSNFKLIIRTEDINYNARKFQLKFEDMPKDKSLLSQIEILMFSELVHYGEWKFLQQNQASIAFAYDIFTIKQADLFQLLPLLLHENVEIPDIGKVDNETPCGIYNYIPKAETQRIYRKYITTGETIIPKSSTSFINSLFSVGETGSIAQTRNNTMKFYICINKTHLSGNSIKLLKKKIEMITKMARTKFNINLFLYLIDIFNAKNNRFDELTFDSKNNLKGKFIKENFYQSMILIAGKLPLWSVLPTQISKKYYEKILKKISNIPTLSRYIDMGDIQFMEPNEFLSVSIWNAIDLIEKPFHSLLTIAGIEEYIDKNSKLACNQYKDTWMYSGMHLRPGQNDPYFLRLNYLLNYYTKTKDKSSSNILLRAFFLHLAIRQTSDIEDTLFGLRKILLYKFMKTWKWNKEQIFSVGNFQNWEFADVIEFSEFIQKYIKNKHERISAIFANKFPDKEIFSEYSIAIINKIFVDFAQKENKVVKHLLLSKKKRSFNSFEIQYIDKEKIKEEIWELSIYKSKLNKRSKESLAKTNSIENLLAWIIHNNLFHKNSSIQLLPNPTSITLYDIDRLYRELAIFFIPLLKKNGTFTQLTQPNKLAGLFVTVNLYESKNQEQLTEYTMIFLNTWGEMFCKTINNEKGFSSLAIIKQDIITNLELNKMPSNTKFYFTKTTLKLIRKTTKDHKTISNIKDANSIADYNLNNNI